MDELLNYVIDKLDTVTKEEIAALKENKNQDKEKLYIAVGMVRAYEDIMLKLSEIHWKGLE